MATEKNSKKEETSKSNTIKVTARWIDEMQNSGKAVIESFLARGIPPTPGYWIGRCLDVIEPIGRRINKEKMKIAEDFALLDDQGKKLKGKQGGVQVDPKKYQEFMEALDPIFDAVEDLGFNPISIDLEELEEKNVMPAPGEWKMVIPLLKDLVQ